MATLYKTDGTVTEVKPRNDRVFSLEELQGFVGGYIESVYMSGKVAFVDEEGLLKRKPYNFLGSKAVGQHLVGDVIVCDEHEVE